MDEEAVANLCSLILRTMRQENPDSIEIGTPAKGGALKVYGNYAKPDEFKKKLDDAFLVRKHAQELLTNAEG